MNGNFLCLLAQFDEATQERLAGYYGILRQNGFEGTQTKEIPYHFTLGKKEVRSEAQLAEELEKLCAGIDRIDIHLSHLGLFAGAGVLFAAPDMNFELLTLQQRFYPHCGNGAYNWTAHATLLIDEPETIIRALPIAVKCFSPFIARIERIGLYEFFPMRFIKEVPLRAVP
ncbi:MAG: 2'-5' RNA ligase [Oscillospiraceae bacterium]|jgi:2'-5' RNA ligase|nr:2'-5' RNA ligase [Oscillospiraceae bacterium]